MSRSVPKPFVKRIVIAVGLSWLFAAGWFQFFEYQEPYHLRASQVQRQAARCSGSFSERYSCNSSLRIAAGRESFALWMTKFLIVFLPPVALAVGYNAASQRVSRKAESDRRRRSRSANRVARPRAATASAPDAAESQQAPAPLPPSKIEPAAR